MHRQIAGKLTGRVTKWVVLVFWIIAVGVLGSFAGKLTEVQNNEASSWLPGQRRVDAGPGEDEAVPGPQRHPDDGRLREGVRLHRRATSRR